MTNAQRHPDALPAQLDAESVRAIVTEFRDLADNAARRLQVMAAALPTLDQFLDAANKHQDPTDRRILLTRFQKADDDRRDLTMLVNDLHGAARMMDSRMRYNPILAGRTAKRPNR